MAIADRILSQYLAQRTFLIGFENATVRSVLALLETSERQILGELAMKYEQLLASGRGIGALSPHLGKGLQFKLAMERQIEGALRQAEREAYGAIRSAMLDISKSENDLLADVLGDLLPKDVFSELPLHKVPIKQLGVLVDGKFESTLVKSARDAIAEINVASQQSIISASDAMARGITEGKSLSGMTADVRRIVGSTRGSPLSHAAARYVRTVMNATANDAASMLYQENADIVKGEQYVATLDDDTCEICGPDDGKVYRFDKGGGSTAPHPPRHPNCRCFLQPWLKDWKQMGLPDDIPDDVKRNLNGRRAERKEWREWVTENPRRLETVLGPSRAKLYRQGPKRGAKLDDFATRNRVLNLKEVAQRRRAAA